MASPQQRNYGRKPSQVPHGLPSVPVPVHQQQNIHGSNTDSAANKVAEEWLETATASAPDNPQAELVIGGRLALGFKLMFDHATAQARQSYAKELQDAIVFRDQLLERLTFQEQTIFDLRQASSDLISKLHDCRTESESTAKQQQEVFDAKERELTEKYIAVISSLNAEAKKRDESLKRLEEENGKLKEDLQADQANRAAIEQTYIVALCSKQRNVNEEQRAHVVTKDQLTSKEAKISELKADLATERHGNAALIQRADIADGTRRAAEDALETNVAEKALLQKELNQTKADFEAEGKKLRTDLKQTKADLGVEKDALRTELTQTKADLEAEKQLQPERVSREVKRLGAIINDLQNRIVQRKDEFGRERARVEQLTKDRDNIASQLDEVREQVEVLRKALNEKHQQLSREQEQIKGLRAKRYELQDELDEASSKVAALEKKLLDQSKEFKELQSWRDNMEAFFTSTSATDDAIRVPGLAAPNIDTDAGTLAPAMKEEAYSVVKGDTTNLALNEVDQQPTAGKNESASTLPSPPTSLVPYRDSPASPPASLALPATPHTRMPLMPNEQPVGDPRPLRLNELPKIAKRSSMHCQDIASLPPRPPPTGPKRRGSVIRENHSSKRRRRDRGRWRRLADLYP